MALHLGEEQWETTQSLRYSSVQLVVPPKHKPPGGSQDGKTAWKFFYVSRVHEIQPDQH